MTNDAQIIKEPIKVICKKTNGSLKLIKGEEYDALSLSTYWSRRYLNIKNVGRYQLSNFTLKNGETLDNMQDFSVVKPKSLNCEDVDYTGQFVRCRCSSNKYLKSNELYYVEGQSVLHLKYGTKYSLKIRGIKTKIDRYNFEEIPLSEQRNLKLKNLNGDTEIKTGEQTRKFLLYSIHEKKSILLELLSKSIIDANKINNKENLKQRIIDMMLMKGKKYCIILEDIEDFMKNKVDELF